MTTEAPASHHVQFKCLPPGDIGITGWPTPDLCTEDDWSGPQIPGPACPGGWVEH